MQKGCQKHELRGVDREYIGSTTPLIKKIINTFDGEILGEKYKPPVKPTRAYKKKYVKSPHKYSYRRDAQ